MNEKSLLSVTTLLVAFSTFSPAQTLRSLTNQPPQGAGLGFLLTDGTLMFQGGGNESNWWKLTPDNFGHYVNGTWSQLASLPSGYSPDAFASAVLADGRVLIEGGEYNFGQFTLTNMGAIYDPTANTWTVVNPPSGWQYIGDSPSAVLPSGKFLMGQKITTNMAELDPATLQWTGVGSTGKSDFNAEEGWTLLPNGTILTVDVKNNPNSEIYKPSSQSWVSAGNTPVNLQGPPQEGCIQYGNNQTYCPPGEIGPAILRPDGTVFATGALHVNASTGHTAIYHPNGTWTAGPDFPNGDDAGDCFASLLPSGNVLVLANSGELYEFNGSNFLSGPYPDGGSLLLLPSGNVIVGGSQIYVPSDTTYSSSWAPSITSYPATVTRGSTYKIYGQQFNGLSQANAFGDEYETNTNYPLVRITNKSTGHVFYARTHDHSTMAVATGKTTVFTNFDVPYGMETGASTLVVVANGIPSTAVSITVK